MHYQDSNGKRGSAKLSNIAEYKNGNWKLAGNLMQGRYGHTAISFQSSIMIVGENTRENIEIWDMNSLQTQIIVQPSHQSWLQSNQVGYTYSGYILTGAFSVDLGFCSKN